MLTDEERNILNHVVVNADKWLVDCLAGNLHRAQKTLPGLSADAYAKIAEAWAIGDLTAKTERWRHAYETARAAEGASYRNRKTRDVEDLRAQRESLPPASAERAHVSRLLSDLENEVPPVRLSLRRAARRRLG